jgi:homocitrate synthase NifV
VVFRDVTLREGLDTPGVTFDVKARARILRALDRVGVDEAEVVAPANVARDVTLARHLPRHGLRLSGLVYVNTPHAPKDAEACRGVLDRLDLLMPMSPRRAPAAPAEKTRRLTQVLTEVARTGLEVGAGFPHAFAVDQTALVAIARAAVSAGARRITVYDTSGTAEPFSVYERLSSLVAAVDVPIFFHGHDDLGLATANAWAAIRAGAAGLDVTVNGLGDRAGNTSLEQAAALLRRHEVSTRLDLARLLPLSRLVAKVSGVPVSPLAPVVGAYAFTHRSPSHLPQPAEFEALPPALLGTRRTLRPSRRRS